MTLKNIAVSLLSLALPMLSMAAPADRLFYPEIKLKVATKTQADIQKALPEIIKAAELSVDASQLQFAEVRESLIGKHYYFNQVINSRKIEMAELVISTDSKTGKIVKVYNNTKAAVGSSKKSISLHPLISQDMALSLVWKKLNASGALIDQPTSALIYSKDLVLVYDIQMSTTAPFGHWSAQVNAVTGEVSEIQESSLPRMKRERQVLKSAKLSTTSFADAMKAFTIKSQKSLFVVKGAPVNGSAQVFDPNPVVTLGRTDLLDTSAGTEFTAAYLTEELKDITLANGVYSLVGPKVTIIDFEEPRVAPSTTADGVWDFERKDVRFNDSMTYYHIDKSIRYIESLGYNAKKIIFPKSIEVDANGVNGDDNSYFMPATKRLAFGHGCVDDNEDSDVILHELGHAIHYHINSSWGGGDTGAMGEGFGDYWAASYSYTTPRGPDTNPNWVFKWDGHNNCWPGRKLNALNMKYDPKKTYGAHSRIGADVSDELWSTPVYQAFLELYQAGVAKTDIDKIILESHFGLGSGLKMPEMAKAIVKTAKALYPTKDYDQVFQKHFQNVSILSK